MKPKVTITIDEKLLDKIRELAKREDRTLSNMIQRLVEMAFIKSQRSRGPA